MVMSQCHTKWDFQFDKKARTYVKRVTHVEKKLSYITQFIIRNFKRITIY